MINLHDYTICTVGGPDNNGGQIALCPICGRAARVERYTPMTSKHPAHYVHRVWLDDETLGQQFDRCRVDDAPRGDGLTHEEAAALAVWSANVRTVCLRLDAALGMGWYEAAADGRGVAYYLAQLRTLLTGVPAAAEVDDGR